MYLLYYVKKWKLTLNVHISKTFPTVYEVNQSDNYSGRNFKISCICRLDRAVFLPLTWTTVHCDIWLISILLRTQCADKYKKYSTDVLKKYLVLQQQRNSHRSHIQNSQQLQSQTQTQVQSHLQQIPQRGINSTNSQLQIQSNQTIQQVHHPTQNQQQQVI